ncbi:hypothetical protein C8Q75DRAFT_865657 [Abortiporus biennis]|nr:hypothetical protein C8Q75DRAFT_865657 [Abortiporus biennis]
MAWVLPTSRLTFIRATGLLKIIPKFQTKCSVVGVQWRPDFFNRTHQTTQYLPPVTLFMWASRNPLLRFIGHTQFLSRIINYNSILTSIDFNATVVTLTKPPSYIENRFKPADPYNIKYVAIPATGTIGPNKTAYIRKTKTLAITNSAKMDMDLISPVSGMIFKRLGRGVEVAIVAEEDVACVLHVYDDGDGTSGMVQRNHL